MRIFTRLLVTICTFGIWSHSQCSAMDLWEFFLGPRLRSSVQDAHSPRTEHQDLKIPEKLAKAYGYRLDTHQVTAETGHVLTLHRLPKGRRIRKKSDNLSNATRPVALLHHGILGSSDMWLYRGPKLSLAYLLADRGYDVWMVNIRGNVYSREHKILNPNTDAEYWQFGVEEIGLYDLSAIIDYVLNVTSQHQVFFLGHSIGTSAALVLCSLRPQYNEKFKLILALGPVANIKHVLNPLHKIVMPMASSLTRMEGISQLSDFVQNLTSLTQDQKMPANEISARLDERCGSKRNRVFYTLLELQLAEFEINIAQQIENIYEILPRRPYFSRMLEMFCRENSPTHELCLNTAFSFVGFDLTQVNGTTFVRLLQYYPAGTSAQVVLSTLQYYLTGNFARFDYGNKMLNVLHYNQSEPPLYNLTKVTAPVSLHYGRGDFLSAEKDIDDLSSKLANVAGKYAIPYKYFNHLDFLVATDVRLLLYDTLLNLMEKYKRNKTV